MGIAETFESLSRSEKITIGVGAVGIVLLIWQPWKSSSAAATMDYTTPGVGVGVGSPSSAVGDASSSVDLTAITSALSALQAKQDALPTANDYSQITNSVSAITTSIQQNQDATNKMLQNQDTYLTNALNRMVLPQVQTPIYTPPAVVVQPQPQPQPKLVTYSQPGTSYQAGASSNPNAFNTIGGGSTTSKPGNTTLNNGNTIKYDNGPSGWTEYNSSGAAVRAGTASPY